MMIFRYEAKPAPAPSLEETGQIVTPATTSVRRDEPVSATARSRWRGLFSEGFSDTAVVSVVDGVTD